MPAPVPDTAIPKVVDVSTSFDALLKTLDEEFARLSSKMLGQFCFSYDGLEFDIRHVKEGEKYHFLINAVVGYMPYTIESAERREAIKVVLMGARTLPKVRFGLDVSGKIIAKALYEIPSLVVPDIIFYPLVLFLQEARPFIGLIGKYISPPKVSAAPKPLPPEKKDSGG